MKGRGGIAVSAQANSLRAFKAWGNTWTPGHALFVGGVCQLLLSALTGISAADVNVVDIKWHYGWCPKGETEIQCKSIAVLTRDSCSALRCSSDCGSVDHKFICIIKHRLRNNGQISIVLLFREKTLLWLMNDMLPHIRAKSPDMAGHPRQTEPSGNREVFSFAR